jgi:hypothetical protein
MKHTKGKQNKGSFCKHVNDMCSQNEAENVAQKA